MAECQLPKLNTRVRFPSPALMGTNPGDTHSDFIAAAQTAAKHIRLPWLEQHHSVTFITGLFALINGMIAIGIMAAAALVTGQPFVFPSLGPTAFLLFTTPLAPSASPKNTILGHGIGAACGYLALVIFGLTHTAPALSSEVTWNRVGAAALSLGLTSALMVWLRVPHPPAGATTLIVSLGILREPEQIVVLMLAVILLVVQGFVISRLAGVNYPIWSIRSQRT